MVPFEPNSNWLTFEGFTLKGVLNNVIHSVWNEVLIIKRRELENPQRLNNGNSGLNK